MLLKDRIAKELDRIRRQGKGLVSAEAVVEYARDKNTALNSQFDWDDSTAAEKYRLQQARKIIARVEFVGVEDAPPVRAFVSLTTDRGERGYRSVAAVLNDEGMTRQMLADALSELNTLRRKYGVLKQLAGVWSAVDAVRPPSIEKEARPAA